MHADVQRWFEARTWQSASWSLADLIEAKARTGETVSLVLPAQNERATVGDVVSGAVRLQQAGLLDEVVVVDSRSNDDTGAIAEAAGARVVHQDHVLPSLPQRFGKGDALYMGVAATKGSIVIFGDTDVEGWDPQFVTGPLGPLLMNRDIMLVDGYYDRPLVSASGAAEGEGGRATEIVARPMLNLLFPQLAGVIQPLGGEYAARRGFLERLYWPVGYGIETAILLDALMLEGLGSIAQVDLGRRVHKHQSTRGLGKMGGEILMAALLRLERYGLATFRLPELRDTLVQFEHKRPVEVRLNVDERPPLLEVPEYLTGHPRTNR